jgi:hypothetical protein
MSSRAIGTFEVKLNPQNDGAEAAVGDLVGTSKGQMLMASSESKKTRSTKLR